MRNIPDMELRDALRKGLARSVKLPEWNVHLNMQFLIVTIIIRTLKKCGYTVIGEDLEPEEG